MSERDSSERPTPADDEAGTASPAPPIPPIPKAVIGPGWAARLAALWRRLVWVRRGLNTLVALLLGAWMLYSTIPRDRLPEDQHERHDELINKMRKLSLSQSWHMYAPNPARGHFYVEVRAYDRDGSVRLLDDSRLAEEGWGTTWAWDRTRKDIWLHTLGRNPRKVNRNRTWYMRGVCMREARRGHEVRRVEMTRVYRRIRSPERVREGAESLGPVRRRKAQDSSCRVRIIRQMIEADSRRRGPGEGT